MFYEKPSPDLKKDYYIGLDIGTNSVGYAVTDTDYALMRYKGEPMWGVNLFDEAKLCNERRGYRTERRRIRRRKMRIQLVRELFAKEIAKVDADFYKRLDESALWNEDRALPHDNVCRPLMDGCPTIHHLIMKLMDSVDGADIRDLYRAVAWLIGHRGHFLNPASVDDDMSKLTDNSGNYGEFIKWFDDNDFEKPWEIDPDKFCEILSEDISITAKTSKLSELAGVKSKSTSDKRSDGSDDEQERLSIISIRTPFLLKLLSGGKVELSKLIDSEEFSNDKESICLKTPEKTEEILPKLGIFADLIGRAQTLFDCASLGKLLEGHSCISEVKVKQYAAHKMDLRELKTLLKKYLSADDYNKMFKTDNNGYDGYINGYIKAKDGSTEKSTEKFYTIVRATLDKIDAPLDSDAKRIDDIKARIELGTYMPKQVSSDNGVIPYQLYYIELRKILENAEKSFPFLTIRDSDGTSVSDKLRSIFTFRIPYYVGPLSRESSHAWIERKGESRIYPWNFDKMVDLDASEAAFIKRMTNKCTYLPGEDVLPKCSLLYSSFEVLNEINPIKIDGKTISPERKQRLYKEVFERYSNVKYRDIVNFLISNGVISKGEEDRISGIDKSIKSSLKPHMVFSSLIGDRKLTFEDAERMIRQITYTNDSDKARLAVWLKSNYPSLSEDDIRRIGSDKFSDFGRLSKELLNGIEGTNFKTGERGTVIHFLWETNDNLMQILESDSYSFNETIAEKAKEYYSERKMSLDEKLEEMGVSNAVKRPIYRSFEILDDIVKVQKSTPKKIFVEMTRSEGEKGKRTNSRYKELVDLLKDNEEILKELRNEGDENNANKKLQKKSLYLYYKQLCKCMYCGKSIDVNRLDIDYDIDHIYPRSLVKNDSIHDNLVLVHKDENGKKTNDLVPEEYRKKMRPIWEIYLKKGLINKTKFEHLTRTNPFTNEEKQGFINRQLVETSQSAKAVATLLKDRYTDTEIVYVKAGNVSEFRHQYGAIKEKVFPWEKDVPAIIKSRTASDIHHAHDAYLNIVVGNVFNERFTKRYHSGDKYSLNFDTLFNESIEGAWNAPLHLQNVDKALANNHIHLTKYQIEQKGGLFDRQPRKAASSDQLVPRKSGFDIQKYGGYQKPSVAFYLLVRYKKGKKYELTILPVRAIDTEAYEKDALETIKRIVGKDVGEKLSDISLPLGYRKIKVNTVFSLDGFEVCISGKTGDNFFFRSLETPFYGKTTIEYIKKIENLSKKRANNKNYQPDEENDGISSAQNLALFDELSAKISGKHFSKMPGGKLGIATKSGRCQFEKSDLNTQISILENMVLYLKTNRPGSCSFDNKAAGIVRLSANISNWLKYYHDIRIIDRSASGLFETRSVNLADLITGGRS